MVDVIFFTTTIAFSAVGAGISVGTVLAIVMIGLWKL
jgi:hypothetical protein